jgi:hypothetical protein
VRGHGASQRNPHLWSAKRIPRYAASLTSPYS